MWYLETVLRYDVRRRARAAEWGSLLRSCPLGDRRFKSCRLRNFDRVRYAHELPIKLPGYLW